MEGGILMVTLKQLVDKENNEMKERRKTETSGCYFVFYIPVAIYMFSSAFWAFPDNGDLYPVCMIICMEFLSVHLLYGYIYKDKENGKSNNIFLKYKYIPVDINQLFLAKIILLGKKLLLIIMPAQILAIIIRITYIFKDSGRLLDIPLFTPSISGIILFLIFSIIIYTNKQAVK